jgi:hypothetical protein
MKDTIEPRVAAAMLASILRCMQEEACERAQPHTTKYYADPGRMALVTQYTHTLRHSSIASSDKELAKLIEDPKVEQLFACIRDYAIRAYEQLMLLEVLTTEGVIDEAAGSADPLLAAPIGHLANRIMLHLEDVYRMIGTVREAGGDQELLERYKRGQLIELRLIRE